MILRLCLRTPPTPHESSQGGLLQTFPPSLSSLFSLSLARSLALPPRSPPLTLALSYNISLLLSFSCSFAVLPLRLLLLLLLTLLSPPLFFLPPPPSLSTLSFPLISLYTHPTHLVQRVFFFLSFPRLFPLSLSHLLFSIIPQLARGKEEKLLVYTASSYMFLLALLSKDAQLLKIRSFQGFLSRICVSCGSNTSNPAE